MVDGARGTNTKRQAKGKNDSAGEQFAILPLLQKWLAHGENLNLER